MKKKLCHSIIAVGVLTAALLLCGFSSVSSRIFKPSWRSCGPEAATVMMEGLEPGELEEAAKVLSGLPKLETVVLDDEANQTLGWDGITLLRQASPQAEIRCKFTLFEQEHDLSDSLLDIKYNMITDGGAELRQIIPLMKNLRTVDMDSCGLRDNVMAELRDDFPDIEIIWRVFFGERYSVRTDTVRILASAPDWGGELLDSNVEGLNYCTKVKYLDLGHNNHLRTLDFIRYMPDLEVAILAMTDIEDFSALADCPKLEYLELFTTRLHDLTPLSGLSNLRHLNICYNFALTDLSPLHSLTGLERLWIGCYDPVSPEQIAQMQECVPGCEINITTSDPTADGWRFKGEDGPGSGKEVPRYSLLREQFQYSTASYDINEYEAKYYDG